MSPRWSQQVSRKSNLYLATCVRQHICIRIQVARPGHVALGQTRLKITSQCIKMSVNWHCVELLFTRAEWQTMFAVCAGNVECFSSSNCTKSFYTRSTPLLLFYFSYFFSLLFSFSCGNLSQRTLDISLIDLLTVGTNAMHEACTPGIYKWPYACILYKQTKNSKHTFQPRKQFRHSSKELLDLQVVFYTSTNYSVLTDNNNNRFTAL